MVTKRKYIIDELMISDFIQSEGNNIVLEEMEESGRSILEIQLSSSDNLTIKNVDKKNTQLLFFKTENKLSMFKRVDHIIFEKISNEDWKLHLVEMKSSVGTEKWKEVKGKFRASYLLSQGIAAMLEMNIIETCMYTSYEKVFLKASDTRPSERRLQVGEKHIKPQEEWDGGEVALNFGRRIKFIHKPIQMVRNDDDILVGKISLV